MMIIPLLILCKTWQVEFSKIKSQKFETVLVNFKNFVILKSISLSYTLYKSFIYTRF